MSAKPKDKPTGLFGQIPAFFGGKHARHAVARLEAFLAAVPGDYCGFAPDGTLAYSDGFCGALGLAGIATILDIQNALSPADAAALESVFARLTDQGTAFTIPVRTADNQRMLRLSGRRGRSAEEQFDILWLEDITAQAQHEAQQKSRQASAEEERDRLRAAFDNMPVPLWMRDSRTSLNWCNKTYARMLDTSAATVIAEQRELPFKPIKKTATGKLPGKALAQAAIDNAAAESAVAHVIAAGQRYLMTVHEVPLPGGAGTLGMAQDITREEV
ncbi:MAG: PAS domain-containing protein, partial [Alphaproteobacteria bacterium]|nr:PAS domain-containing protein [Alphaproteobacteria bacterium]